MSLAEQVAAGKLDAAEAGRKMKSLLTVRKAPVTMAEKRERFNEAALETDPNSWVNVEVLKDAGELSAADYKAIRSTAVGG